MFRGHSLRSLDPKGRLMLPPEFRAEVTRTSTDGHLMLTNFDGAVSGYPMPEWEKIESAFQKANKLNRQMRNLERFLLSGAMEVTVDKQGRILIPPHLRRYAGLEKDLVLAGLGAKFEIWDQARFEERRREMEESFDDDMAALAENGIELPL